MTIFNNPEFKKYQSKWHNRLAVLNLRHQYFTGEIYSQTNSWGSIQSKYPRLYKDIKPLYLMLFRAVDTDTGLVPGDWQLTEDSKPYQDSFDSLLNISQWDTDGVLLIHYGAVFGLSGIKVWVNEVSRLSGIAPVSPLSFMVADDLGFEISKVTNSDGKRQEKAIVYSNDSIRSFLDGVPFEFDGIPSEYPNPLPIQPFIEIQHIREGTELGTPTFDKVTPMLDSVNNMGANLLKIIERHGEPQWVSMGIQPSDMQKSGQNMWFVQERPDEASIQSLVAPVDIPGMLSFVESVKEEVKAGLPELAFDEIKQGQIATATVELQLAELITKIKRIRPNYDNGLLQAIRLSAIGMQIIGGDRVISNDLLSPDFAFDKKRDILPKSEKEVLELGILRNTLDSMEAPQEGVIA